MYSIKSYVLDGPKINSVILYLTNSKAFFSTASCGMIASERDTKIFSFSQTGLEEVPSPM